MEQRVWRNWSRGVLLGLILLLGVCAGIVYRVDPCFYYLSFSANGTRPPASSGTTRRT